MKINKRFSIDRDKYNFIVIELIPTRHRPGCAKPKKPFRTKAQYFTKLTQACLWILEKEADLESVETVLASIERAKAEIIDAVKDYTEES